MPWPFEPEDWDKNADIPDGVAADLRRHPTGARDPIAGLPMYTSGREPGTNSWRRWGAPKLIDYALEGPPWSLKSDGATKVLRRAYASSVTRTDAQLEAIEVSLEERCRAEEAARDRWHDAILAKAQIDLRVVGEDAAEAVANMERARGVVGAVAAVGTALMAWLKGVAWYKRR